MINLFIKFSLFSFFIHSLSFAKILPIPEFDLAIFSEKDVVFFDFSNKKYYGIIVTAPLSNLDQKNSIKIKSQMEIKAKGKLSNYLNKKYRKESIYNFSSFAKHQSCNFENTLCNIYIIGNDDIRIENNTPLKQESIKNEIISNTIGAPNGINIIKINEALFLVSHFKESVKNSSPIERISIIKKTDIQAEKNLSLFINASVIDVKEQLISKSISSQYGIEISEDYIEKIKESSKGLILNSKKISNLYDNSYSSIIYIEIPSP